MPKSIREVLEGLSTAFALHFTMGQDGEPCKACNKMIDETLKDLSSIVLAEKKWIDFTDSADEYIDKRKYNEAIDHISNIILGG